MTSRYHIFSLMLAICLAALSGCAMKDSAPLRKVSAAEFMRPHTFKGVPTDQFIGVTQSGFGHSRDRKPENAFKKIWEMGLFHSWAVLWCPADELPADYLRNAHVNPNRPIHPMDSRRRDTADNGG